MSNIFIHSFFLTLAVSTVFSLECYVCENQPNNKDKCIKTTIQCEMNYDTCMSVFKQVQAPFWTPRMKRIFLISKSCNTTAACQKYRHHLNKNQICSRDWYLDWECAECCQGEKCNYYVTLGSDFRKPSLLLITFTALISIAVSSFLR